MSTIIRSEKRVNAGEGLIISKWNTAQSALTELIKTYEYIEMWLVLMSNKGDVNDHSVLMTEIRRQALPGCRGVWVMVVKYIS